MKTLATILYLSGWFAIGLALRYRIRKNRRRYRMRRADRSLSAWIRNDGRWHEFEDDYYDR